MGREYFEDRACGTNVKEAFDTAHFQACYDHGHAGYSGTLAEKPGYEVHEIDAEVDTPEWKAKVQELTNANDKWGPAVAIKIRVDDGPPAHELWMFCGWASS